MHGDGRVHDINTVPDGPSGFGFELTFRLKCESGETAPPTWPATLMQSLAKYVFHSGNNLCVGDHVSWHCALDNSESRIQHMLMAKDPQLSTTRTPFGIVEFVEIVGVCADELQASQQWNGVGVLDMISRFDVAGGKWLITDMRRGESIFELDPNAHEEVERGFETGGSNLSGVSARCSWNEIGSSKACSSDTPHISEEESDQIRLTLQRGLNSIPGLKTKESQHSLLESTELLKIRKLDGLHLTFNLEAGSLLPLAIRGRVRHGRHFTFKSVLGETAITLVASSVTGTLVDSEKPYVSQGAWLQVLIPDELIPSMAQSFETLTKPEQLALPKTFSWPDRKLSVTIVADKI